MEQALTKIAIIILSDYSTGFDDMSNFFAKQADIMIDIVHDLDKD